MSVFVPILKKNDFLDRIHMIVCNVGSRKLGDYDDYASQGWGLFSPNLTIYGFDADEEACEVANADLEARQIDWKEVHIPLALGKAEEERTLYVTKAPMCSSLYQPNETYLGRFAGLPELVNVDFSCQVETNTLDDFCELEEINEISFLQIDVQGADLDVLEGASKILDSVSAIQIEVEFSHLYIDQPLFADVDTFLRKQGFTLFDISTAHRVRANSPIRSKVRAGQLLWGDAFYLRDPIQSKNQNPDQILKIACVADVLGFPDYALELLEYLTLNYGKDRRYNLSRVIIESLSQFPDLVNQGLNALPVVSRLQEFLDDLDELSPHTNQLRTLPPLSVFHSVEYLRHNHRRLEHLVSLNLNISGSHVLEVGAGIGDHSEFFIDRNCSVVITEGRLENVELLRSRYSSLDVRHLDMENPYLEPDELFDIVYCYGLLYHINKPLEAIEFMSQHTKNLLLLETCVSFGDEEAINFVTEDANYPSQSTSGYGCRPTRSWIYSQLKQQFEFVYMPITQPNHEQFPLDWQLENSHQARFARAVFIASRYKIENTLLIEGIPMKQTRH